MIAYYKKKMGLNFDGLMAMPLKSLVAYCTFMNNSSIGCLVSTPFYEN